MTDNSIEPQSESDVVELDGMKNEAVDWRETLPAAEFCCWVVVLLAPMLRWINGAAVTDDQFYIQVGLTTMALSGAVTLRIWNWKRARGVIVGQQRTGACKNR